MQNFYTNRDSLRIVFYFNLNFRPCTGAALVYNFGAYIPVLFLPLRTIEIQKKKRNKSIVKLFRKKCLGHGAFFR